MTDFRELSKLPRDPAYWTQLEMRIVSGLGTTLRHAGEADVVWWAPLAARAWSLGALAAAAAVAALLALPPRGVEPQRSPAGLLMLPGDDPSLVALLAGSEPPKLAALLTARRWEEGR